MDSRYYEHRREMKNSLLCQELVSSKIEKSAFPQILNPL